jgi:hypothetical protein
MRKTRLIIAIIILTSYASISGQDASKIKGLDCITPDILKAQLGFLSSDWMEGRMAGERGERIAGDYIASMLKLYEIKPAGDYYTEGKDALFSSDNEISYFQNFIMIKSIPDNEQILKIISNEGNTSKAISLSYNIDYTYRNVYQNIEIEAPVIFVGYGYKNDKLKYNDFKNVDIKGKFLLKLTGAPDCAKKTLTKEEFDSSVLSMESEIKSMGAVGIIEFNPVSLLIRDQKNEKATTLSPSEQYPEPLDPNANYSLPSNQMSDNIIKIYLSAKAANEILKDYRIKIDEYIKKANNNESFSIDVTGEKKIFFKSGILTSKISVRNILGIIEGNNLNSFIVVGAHYDHMGIHKGFIWNGADDNGSGTVGVLSIARAIIASGKKPEKSIIIALWTAEEEGLLGSRYWLQNIEFPVNNILLNINFDMISRYISETEQKKVTLTYTNTCPQFRDITKTNLTKFGIDLDVDYQPSNDPPGGTDHRTFAVAGIPVMRFKAGHRKEYHTPSDDYETVDWNIMEKIVKISYADIFDLANTK